MEDRDRKTLAIEILTGPYGQQLLTNVARYTSPFFFGEVGKANKINNGTIFFVNLGQGPLGISAAHVYTEFLEKKSLNKSIICHIGNHMFDPEESLISINPELDIVTFRVDKKWIDKLGKIIHTPIWPPDSRPQKGNTVALAGFPGVERLTKTNSNEINFGIAMYLMVIESVNDRHITCMYSEANVDVLGLGLPPKNFDLGGISGAPLLLIHESPVISWSLCGVVNQASKNLEMVTAKYADLILPDGQIKIL